MLAVRPRFCFFLSFSQSSRKPIAPNTRANSSTKICTQFPFTSEGRPMVRHTNVTARMNMTPPMVGVPVFAMCQVGPFSFISCPAFCLRSHGI